ncbi:MAG: Rieske 2Fe-2S domain-containing protein [Myxococcales bacterium]|nr:Rieske 2Fe-2S domain-containing protein [Myxococcales bacterium]MCB9641681.1 Rieske 2Fe-2S domain-containing protein [Myxococcales bacterium]
MKQEKLSRRDFTRLVGGACIGCSVALIGVLDGCDKPSLPDGLQPDGEMAREAAAELRPEERTLVQDGTAEVKAEKRAETAPDGTAEPNAEPVPEASPEPEPVIETPPIDLSGRTYKEVNLNQEPDMSKIGWYINVLLPNDDLVYLFRRSATQLSSVSGTCTHNGCFVGWRSTERRFICPCHTARFTQDGTVIDGPAPRSLKSYEVAWDAKTNIAYIFLD